MIINIRGTSGSGKSHLVRSIMALYPYVTPTYEERRRRPISYLCKRQEGDPLFIPGHYETPTGGCDTIRTPNEAYNLVQNGANGNDVLFEGIMIGDDVKRCVDLSKTYPVLVIALNTPIDQCLAGIQERRNNRGDGRVLNPKNTVDRADRLKRSMMPRLKDAGVEAVWLSRDEALKRVKECLNLNI